MRFGRRRPCWCSLPVRELASAGDSTPATGIDISPAQVSGPLKDYAYEDGFTPGYVASFKKEYPNVQLQTQAFRAARRR